MGLGGVHYQPKTSQRREGLDMESVLGLFPSRLFCCRYGQPISQLCLSCQNDQFISVATSGWAAAALLRGMP